ncbi:THUMP-like domain-containing protein [Nocardia callitridis]|uniref:THUMP-like domain-containing protein n=1 Tax=Nocardia callitridis TaxID=648753 RepID=A0ABP9KS91_9NOCA
MGYGFSRADVAFLSGAAGAAALARVDRLELTTATHLRDLESVRRAFGASAAALVETVRLRRKAGVKLLDAAHWLFTDDALQQATPTLVARRRAMRLAGRAVHDVTCSIGAEIAELAAICPRVLGSDLDDVRLSMAAHNLAGSRNVLLARADALAPVSTDTVVLADPARRADGRRTHDPAKLQPPLPDLIAAYPGRDLVVKCAPGLDFDRLGWAGEVEVVSLDGSVREACLWSSGLADPTVTRRATVLRSNGSEAVITDAEPDEIAERAPGEWILDPDGAVVRAGLVRHFAAKHGLWQLDPRIAYLTGDHVPAGMRGFRVLDRFELREKTVRAQLRKHDCGALEIMTRGVDLDPDSLRRRMKPQGTQPYTLIITRIGRTPTVFLCTATAARAAGREAALD